jgi:diadenosine tetraphosphatase ApaH/serine/threonine PP2A family protein phosphatase
VRGGNAEGEDPKLKEGSVLMRDRRGPMPWNGTGVRAALVAAVLVGVALVPRGVAAQTQASSPTAFDDGPHVFWANATNAFVFYICGGQFKMERYRVSGSLTFKGLCADSLVQRTVSARAPKAGPFEYDGVDRIFTVSDIHGEYDALVGILRKAGVVDDDLRWAWGKGHLVVLGDVFDRGGLVTECLWLIHRLEAEAEKAGGRVHYLLGNHEMMVLRGDLRYVNARYADGIVKMTRIAYPDLFGPDMELGRWLRSKPLVLKLNDIVFVHGGLAPDLVARGLDIPTLNKLGRASIDLSSVEVVFSEMPALLLGSTGPLWYRGYFSANNGRYTATTSEELDAILQFYGASSIVVGHTDIGQVMRLHDGRVFGVDVSLEDLGAYQGLLWEDGVFSVVTGLGTVVPFEEGG